MTAGRAALLDRVTSGPWETAGDDTQFRVEVDGSLATVLFQCSSSVADWFHNLDFPPVAYRDSPAPWRAHRGFLRAWKSVRDEIAGRVSGAQALLAVGYSHGGPLAAMCMEDWEFTHGCRGTGHAVTFGSPRFAFMPPAAVRRRFVGLTRVEASGDPVTMVPPPFGFVHVGARVSVGPWCPVPLPSRHAAESYRRWL